MTPEEQSAADAAWRAIHKGIDPRMFPSITFTGKSMYAAGLAHAREQAAAQLDDRAEQEIKYGALLPVVEQAFVFMLREQAAKIRSGE